MEDFKSYECEKCEKIQETAWEWYEQPEDPAEILCEACYNEQEADYYAHKEDKIAEGW